MIEIFNEVEGSTESFQSYDALLKHIKEIEEQKQQETRLKNDRELWSFIIHPNQRLSSVYWRAIKATSILLTEKEQDAYEKGLNLLEMCNGTQDNLTQIILTPDINLKEITKSWCRDYCLNHGYIILGINL
jgi:hypothetical protein